MTTPLIAPAPLARRIDAVLERLASSPAARRVVVLIGLLLSATSVGPHRVLDDYVLALIARGRGAPLGLDRGSLDLFTFTTGDTASNHRLMDVGLMLPWWTDPELKIAFLRPVTALTHWVDERLFPSSPALMHVHSLAWFAALLTAVGVLFTRIDGSRRAAGLAFVVYAVDDAHGPTVAWLANRNALVAGTFGVLALVFHDTWRRRGFRLGAIASAVALLAGLLAGELAIGAVAYLVAYAVFLDDEPPAARARSLVPSFAVVVAWRLFWLRAGYGAAGSGAYVDPLASPGAFLTELPLRIAVLLHGQFSAPPSDLAFLAPPSHRPLLVGIAVLTVALVTWLVVPQVRSDRTSRFWALGTGLAVLPLAATFPSDRLLLFVGVGASGLLGRLFVDAFERARRGERQGFRGVLTACFAALHLVGAPLLLPLRAAQMELFAVAHDRGARAIFEDAANAEHGPRTTIVVAAPTVLFANYIQAEAAVKGRPRPEHIYVLSSASSPITVERAGPHAVVLRPEQGFLYTPLERHYRGTRPLGPGDRVELSAMTATVLDASEGGRPRAVRFDLGTDGREPSIVTWRDGRFVPFTLPAEGHPVILPEEDFGKILLAAALGGA